jgi:hypothetical protein
MTEPNSERLRRMRALTRIAHAGQTRSGGRVPYWVHTDGVAAICANALGSTAEHGLGDAAEDLLLAAHGHDLYEDTPVGPDVIRREFGARVDEWISGMTNRHGDLDRAGYIAHIAAAADEVRLIKCADLIDNTLSVVYGLQDVRLDWALGFFLPIATETRQALHAAPFTRLPGPGTRLIDLVDWSCDRLRAAVQRASETGWAGRPDHGGDLLTDSDREPRSEELAQWLAENEFTDDQWKKAKRQQLQEEIEQGRRLFPDGKPPFLIPDVDTDA